MSERTSNLSNIDDDHMMCQDVESDSFSHRFDDAEDDITRLRQNSSFLGRPESFKLLRAEASVFFKERTSSTSNFVENAKEWGRTASFDLGRNSRPPSFDLGRQSRDPSCEYVGDVQTTPTLDSSRGGRSSNNSNNGGFFRAPSLERTNSFDMARNILCNVTPTPSDFNMFSKKRSQHPSHDGPSKNLSDTPWKRGGKNSSSSSSSSSSFVKTSRMQADYHIIDVIGSGNFGSVYRAKRTLDNMVYAVKQSRQQANNTAERSIMLREVQVLARLNAEESMENLSSIVRYYSSWIEDDFLYIQMEICEASVDLVFFDAANIATLFRDMLSALKVVHRHDIVHLDIKPGNILLKNNRFKLCDFGMSLQTVNGVYTGDIDEGDSRYMALELLDWECSSDLRKCDIFSLGITGKLHHAEI